MKHWRSWRLPSLLLVSVVLLGGAERAGAEEVTPGNAAKTGAARAIKGLASYYAEKYNGRKTSSGVPHDPLKLTAAHNTLPLGTRVKVVNEKNGREVVVVVNDRCAKKKIPFIDLSREAARRLGFLGAGTAAVTMLVLDTPAG